MAVKVKRIHLMIHKDGLVPAGVYKAEGFFKAYDVYMNGDFFTNSVTKTFRKSGWGFYFNYPRKSVPNFLFYIKK